MRSLFLNLPAQFLLGALLIVGASVAPSKAAETPSILVQGNAPGWITVTYAHSGTDGVLWYRVEREGGFSAILYSPNGQWTDSHLEPDTVYAYRVCAIYQDELACSDWFSARTLPGPGRVANSDPPVVTNIDVAPNTIRVTWGSTGDYSRILARLEDARGYELVQLDLPNTPYGSQTFDGLLPGANYRVLLKGCSLTILGSSNCGEWSIAMVATPALPVDPPPPTRPTLTVAGYTDTTISLAFSVNLVRPNALDRFELLRAGAQLQSVMPVQTAGGWAGTYTDTVDGQHQYQVCFQGFSPPARVCSVKVVDPVLGHGVARNPNDPIDLKPRPLAKGALRALAPFSGSWNSGTNKGYTYTIQLTQSGGSVTGQYVVDTNGARGRISGSVANNVLTFSWDQDDGFTGTGQFTLSGDGNTFSGSYRTDPNPALTPDLLTGIWDGRRQ